MENVDAAEEHEGVVEVAADAAEERGDVAAEENNEEVGIAQFVDTPTQEMRSSARGKTRTVDCVAGGRPRRP